MRNLIWSVVVLSVLLLTASCGGSGATVTAPPPQAQQPLHSSIPTTIAGAGNVDPAPNCPPARGVGTVSPAVTIYSFTLLVNGQEQVVQGDEVLTVAAGDQVQVTEVTICTNPFSGEGGAACVDFSPLDQTGQEIQAERQGTHTVPVNPGLFVFLNLNYTWTIDPDWSGFSAVLNHWTLEKTQDQACSSGRCERDDRIILEFR